MIMGHRPKPSVDKLLHLSTPVKVISCCWATFNKQTLIEKSTTPVTIFQRSRPKTFASVTPNWDQKSDRRIPLRQILEMREHLMLGLVFEPAHFGRYFLTENGAIDPFYYSPTHSFVGQIQRSRDRNFENGSPPKILASYVITRPLNECFCATETTNFQFTVWATKNSNKWESSRGLHKKRMRRLVICDCVHCRKVNWIFAQRLFQKRDKWKLLTEPITYPKKN